MQKPGRSHRYCEVVWILERLCRRIGAYDDVHKTIQKPAWLH